MAVSLVAVVTVAVNLPPKTSERIVAASSDVPFHIYALRSAVIQCDDGAETFLACSILQYIVPRKAQKK